MVGEFRELAANVARLALGPERAGLLPCEDSHGQVVTCCRCGSRVSLSQVYADPSGPAFVAYYCRAGCAEWRAQLIEQGVRT